MKLKFFVKKFFLLKIMIVENYEESLRPLVEKFNKVLYQKDCILKKCKDAGIIIKKGQFNEKERELIEKEINKFLDLRGYTFKDLQNYVSTFNTNLIVNFRANSIENNFPYHDLCVYIAERMDKRTCKSIYRYMRYFADTNSVCVRKQEEIELLCYLEKYGRNIKLINTFLKKKIKTLYRAYTSLTTSEKIDFDKFIEKVDSFKKTKRNVKRSDIAKSLKTTIKSIEQHFSKFMRININKEWNKENGAFLLLFILNYNYFTPFGIKIESIFEIFNNENIIKDLVKEISEKRINKEKEIDEIIKNKIEENIFSKIKGESKKKFNLEDIFFTNIVLDWNEMFLKHHVHRSLLKEKLTDLIKAHSIVNYNDILIAFKKETYQIFEDKVFQNLLNNLNN